MITFSHITQGFIKTFRRFPIAFLFAWAGAIAGLILVETPPPNNETFLPNLLMTSVLGFFMFTAIPLFLERQKSKTLFIALNIFGLAFLEFYYLLLPNDFDQASAVFVIRFILFIITLLFGITFVPFFRKDEVNGFWQHNKTLFIRLFFTGVYMGIFYLGLVLAMASSDYLLGIEFNGETYFQVWIAVVGFLATAFFLAGVPQKTADLQKQKDYPKGIKIFSQYILTPLLSLYSLILYAYLAKILITGIWPEGTVSYLILAFSLVGIFTYFLLFPTQKEDGWVRWFSRIFFAAILPLIFMLFAAVWIRVAEYGLTEKRYYVIVLGVWLFGISLYFLISKKKNLKIISISLFLIAFLSSFGPWGSMALSEASQFHRLEEALIRNNLLPGGKLVKPTQEISFEDRAIISGALEYLYDFHGLERLQPWFNENIMALRGKEDCYDASCIARKMEITYLYAWERHEEWEDGGRPMPLNSYSVDYGMGQVIAVSGYDFSLQVNVGVHHPEGQTFEIGSTSYRLVLNQADLEIYKEQEFLTSISLEGVKASIPEGSLTFKLGDVFFEGDPLKFIFRSIDGVQLSEEGDWESVDWIDGILLIREDRQGQEE